MLRATIATRRMMLEGCDAMNHADKFPLFASDSDLVDFHMSVSYAEHIAVPVGKPIGEYRQMRWVETENGEHWLYHTKGGLALSYNPTFSENSLILNSKAQKKDILHYLYVSQCFSYHLLHVGGGLLHASGLKCGDSGIALCGQSGHGKSTLTKLWLETNSDVSVLCEDKPAMTFGEDVLLHGTPFCGDDNRCCNDIAPLRAIVLLKRGTDNRLTTPSASQRLAGLLEVLTKPAYHRSLSEKAVDMIQALIQRVPVYVFEHDATPAALTALQTALKADGFI